jgi:hypothetical protein
MNKALILVLILDLLIISLVSAITSFGFYMLNFSFFSTFFISFGIIFFIGILFNILIDNKNKRDNIKDQLEIAKTLASQKLTVNCAYCRVKNEEYIRTDKDIEFDCISCKQPNKVVLQYGAVRITTPI